MVYVGGLFVEVVFCVMDVVVCIFFVFYVVEYDV